MQTTPDTDMFAPSSHARLGLLEDVSLTEQN